MTPVGETGRELRAGAPTNADGRAFGGGQVEPRGDCGSGSEPPCSAKTSSALRMFEVQLILVQNFFEELKERVPN